MSFPLQITVPTPKEIKQLEEASRILLAATNLSTRTRFKNSVPEATIKKLCEVLLNSSYILAVFCHHQSFHGLITHYPELFKETLDPYQDQFASEIEEGQISDVANAWLRLASQKPFAYNLPSLLPLIPQSHNLDLDDLPLFGNQAEDVERSPAGRLAARNLVPSLRNLVLHYTPLAKEPEFSGRLWSGYRHAVISPGGAKSLCGNLHFSKDAALYLFDRLGLELIRLANADGLAFPAVLRDALAPHVPLDSQERAQVLRLLAIPNISKNFFVQTKTYVDDPELYESFLATKPKLGELGGQLLHAMSLNVLASRLPRLSPLLDERTVLIAFRRLSSKILASYSRTHWAPLLSHPDKEVRLASLAFINKLEVTS